MKSLYVNIYLKTFPFARKSSWTQITPSLILVIKERFLFVAFTKIVAKALFVALF